MVASHVQKHGERRLVLLSPLPAEMARAYSAPVRMV
jgi:hypothetical protein